jgi:hypothetical protein
MRLTSCLSVAVVVFIGACKKLDLPESRALAAFTLDSVALQGEEYRTRAVGVFLSEFSGQLPDSRFVRDSCRTLPYPLQSTPGSGNTIDAGTPVTVRTDKATGPMFPVTGGSITQYELQGDGRIAFTPGTPVAFDVPGAPNGYPQTSVTGVTAAPLQLGPVDTLPEDTGLILTWNASSDSSAVVISLQYGTTADRTTADEQIYCSLADDGVDTLNFTQTLRWRQAPAITRRVTAYRWRSTLQPVSAEAIAIVISQFDIVPKTTFP